MNTFSRKFFSGFTLIELLVVIAIIAVLAALIFAGVTTVRKKGDQAKDLANVKSISTGMLTFAAEKGQFPDGTGGLTQALVWDVSLFPYLGGKVPDNYNKNEGVTGSDQGFYKIFASPIDKAERSPGKFKRSYAVPGWVANLSSTGAYAGMGVDWSFSTGARTVKIKKPSAWVILSMAPYANLREENVLGKNSYGAGVWIGKDMDKWPYGQRAPFGFADGHVEFIEAPAGGFKNEQEFMAKYADNRDN